MRGKRSLSKNLQLTKSNQFFAFQSYFQKALIQEISDNIKSRKSIYLFSYSYYFYKSFRSNFKNGRFVPLRQDNWLKAIDYCKKSLCFFHVSGDRSAKRLSEIPKNLLKNLVVINTSDPAITESFHKNFKSL